MDAPSSTPAGPVPICQIVGVHKSYGGVRALAGVDLEIHPGRILAVVGENGAGKSTLMKILAGAERPDEGFVIVRGKPVTFASTADAASEGITIVFQELSLFPDLDVLANLFIGREPTRFGLISRRSMKAQVRSVLAELGADFDLGTRVGALRLADRQIVEIARATIAGADVIVLDEPNSALNAVESERLFKLVRRLRDNGVAILYVSHRLEEVLAIADDITVMRDGAIVRSVPAASTSISEIVTAMIGHAAPERVPHQAAAPARAAALQVSGLAVEGKLYGVSLDARAGEVVGLAGLDGAGVRALFDVLFGILPPASGTVSMPGGGPLPRDTADAVRRRVAHVPSDRRAEGLLLDQPVSMNMGLVVAGVLERGWWVRRRTLMATIGRLVASLQIRTSSLSVPVSQLSGGNQQKVVIGKWLAADPSLVLLDDPTRGVDVGSKEEIYGLIRRLADEGRIVLFTSSELSEYERVCDRVEIFYRGRITGSLRGAELTEHRLLNGINTGQGATAAAGAASAVGSA
jgi:ABC-type sugar transport system ATPase subunit